MKRGKIGERIGEIGDVEDKGRKERTREGEGWEAQGAVGLSHDTAPFPVHLCTKNDHVRTTSEKIQKMLKNHTPGNPALCALENLTAANPAQCALENLTLGNPAPT